jgi:hypothetical protein
VDEDIGLFVSEGGNGNGLEEEEPETQIETRIRTK